MVRSTRRISCNTTERHEPRHNRLLSFHPCSRERYTMAPRQRLAHSPTLDVLSSRSADSGSSDLRQFLSSSYDEDEAPRAAPTLASAPRHSSRSSSSGGGGAKALSSMSFPTRASPCAEADFARERHDYFNLIALVCCSQTSEGHRCAWTILTSYVLPAVAVRLLSSLLSCLLYHLRL